jgi:hypothetical protein
VWLTYIGSAGGTFKYFLMKHARFFAMIGTPAPVGSRQAVTGKGSRTRP